MIKLRRQCTPTSQLARHSMPITLPPHMQTTSTSAQPKSRNSDSQYTTCQHAICRFLNSTRPHRKTALPWSSPPHPLPCLSTALQWPCAHSGMHKAVVSSCSTPDSRSRAAAVAACPRHHASTCYKYNIACICHNWFCIIESTKTRSHRAPITIHHVSPRLRHTPPLFSHIPFFSPTAFFQRLMHSIHKLWYANEPSELIPMKVGVA